MQRRAMKLITGMQNLSYDDRVKHLGLMRLNTRRLRSDLVETFKIINGNYSIDAEIFLILLNFCESMRHNVRAPFFQTQCSYSLNKLQYRQFHIQ